MGRPIIGALLALCASVGLAHGLSKVAVGPADLDKCLVNPELIVSAVDGANRSDLEIRFCNYLPSNGEQKVILVSVRGEEYAYWLPTPLGAKVYAEYRFAPDQDLLIMAYGFDSPDEDGNYFDYDIYRVGESGVWKSGRAKMDRPRLAEVL